MRLSREKIIRLSHQITDVLVASDEVEFVDDRDTIRQQVVQILTATLATKKKPTRKSASASLPRKKKSSKAAKSGTCSTASITPTSSAAWASLRLPMTGVPATPPDSRGRSPGQGTGKHMSL